MTKLIEEADEDNSGGIDLNEFINLMRQEGKFSIPPQRHQNSPAPEQVRRRSGSHTSSIKTPVREAAAVRDEKVYRRRSGSHTSSIKTPVREAAAIAALTDGGDGNRNGMIPDPVPYGRRPWNPELLFGDGPPPSPP